ncbi:hypothetical protein FIBSPDRAFT_782345 [Athelia psychrophila]|uniref:Heme haloperoxidase family profile domain-containing protein n=1 Tax=Athelia psychrophila TaxID=1759441 RepID=A0A166PID6_9AGAM|nr:hypothetical protein FIBSPDRAFT_782345 [Fibularhizoctonia sp. CBS 109695]
MIFATLAVLVAAATSTAAQRPTNTSICDYYTTALLTTNNATNQYTLLTLLVNTAVIGNYTQPNHNAVPGILSANGTFNGTPVNLAPYFSGGLESTNVNGAASAVNFLDDGGAAPLMKNMPAAGTTSNQYKLLTHLYSYFGAALGCSTYSEMGFPAYAGQSSMYSVHKYMGLDANEVGYFITQVGLSAQSFGVAAADVTAVGTLLEGVFDVKCAAATTVIPAQGAQLQSICTADDCPTAANASCSAYGTVPSQPASATGSASGSRSTSAPAGGSSSGAGAMGVSGLLAGVAAFLTAML